jgi:peptidoglycan/LPS O-acetylase OafA/YrhL
MSPARATPIPSLDGLRAVAVLTVLTAHVLEHAEVTNVFPGSFGVTIFFFLSGYLITTLMRLEHEQTGKVSFRQFYLRRALRILPPFYLVLCLATLATALGWLPNTLDPRAVLAQALHLTNYYIVDHGWWYGIAPGTFIFWSLAVEEHFYLVFPWLFALLLQLKTRKQQAWTLLALAFAALLWRCVLVFAFGATKNRIYPATDTRFDSLLFGCALALWGNPALDPTRLSARTWQRVLLPLALAGLAVSFVLRAPWFLETFRYSLQGLCLFPVYVVAVRYPAWGAMRALNAPFMKWLGRISYSLYLVHPILLEALTNHLTLPAPVLFVAGYGLCIGVAALLYESVERPLGRLRQRFERGAARPAPVAAQLCPPGARVLRGRPPNGV